MLSLPLMSSLPRVCKQLHTVHEHKEARLEAAQQARVEERRAALAKADNARVALAAEEAEEAAHAAKERRWPEDAIRRD